MATGDVYEVTLENYTADTPGAGAIYEKFGDGYYFDGSATMRMSAGGNPVATPVREGYEFGGYWTDENGSGTCVIDENGYLTADASPVAFTAPGTLYARWYTTAKYMDADGRTVCATQKVPINIPTEPLDIDDIPYSKKPPEGYGWELDCYADFSHRIDVSNYGSSRGWSDSDTDDDYWLKTGCTEPGWDEVYIGYNRVNKIPTRYYADEDAKLLLTEETELDPEWRRTIHCVYYVDGHSTLTKEARFPQGYSAGWVFSLTYEADGYGKQTEKYWQRYTTTQFPPQHLYDDIPSDGTMANGWLFQGWSCFREDDAIVSKHLNVGTTYNAWPEVRLPSPGTSHYVTVDCCSTTHPDDGNWWYGVYSRDVTVLYDANGGTGTVAPSKFEQCITCRAPASTKPYGALTGNSASWSRPGYSYMGLMYDDPGSWSYVDDPAGDTLYQFKKYVNDRSSVASWSASPAQITMYAAWVINTNTVALDDTCNILFFERGADKVYYKQDTGYYRDYACRERMTASENPVKPATTRAYGRFLGYYTEPYANGVKVIDENGYLAADEGATLFPAGGTLYGAWVETHAEWDPDTATLTLFESSALTDKLGGGRYVDAVRATDGSVYGGSGRSVYVNAGGQESFCYNNTSLWTQLVHARVGDGQHVQIQAPTEWFYNCSKLEDTQGFERIDMSGATRIDSMFAFCHKLASPPDTSTWDLSGVTSAASMFRECIVMDRAPDARTWGMGRCTNMSFMFERCWKMTGSVDMSGWDTAKVRSTQAMFRYCRDMGTPNTSGCDFGAVTNASEMFYFATCMLTAPDTSTWGMGSCKNMSNMFDGCRDMANPPDTSRWDTSSCKDMSHMFYNCSTITAFPDVSRWDTSSVTTMQGMFENCFWVLLPPDVSNWDVGRVENMQDMFINCSELVAPPAVGGWDVRKLKYARHMFAHMNELSSPPDVSAWQTESLEECYSMFEFNKNMASPPDMSGWDVSRVGHFTSLFRGCEKMTAPPDTSAWCPRSANSFSMMFDSCKAMASGPETTFWDTRSLIDAGAMFNGCTAMTSIPKLFAWDYDAPDHPVSLSTVFAGCKSLKEIDAGAWNVKNISSAYLTFSGCSSLEVLDIGGLGTANAESMGGFFSGDAYLKRVTLGEDFVFNDSTAERYATKAKPLLPTPRGLGYWINVDHADAEKVTSTQLHDGYEGTGSDNSLNAGTYCAVFTVTYYNNYSPMAASEFPWGVEWPLLSIDDTAMDNKPDLSEDCGWVFSGWATSNYTERMEFFEGDSATFTEDVKLYCVYWRPLYFTYYANSAASTPQVDTIMQYYHSGGPRFAVAPALAASDYGWEPLSWYETDTATPAGGTISLLPPPPADRRFLLASNSNLRWFYGAYDRDIEITYEGNRAKSGSTEATTLSQFFVAGFARSALPTGTLAENGFVKDDCEFVCWTLGSTDGPEYEEGAAIPADASLGSTQAWATETPAYTMHAKWRALRITFEVPTRIELDALADGTVLAPSPSATTIDNLSPFDIDIVGYRVAPEDSGIDLVEHVETADELAVTVKPGSYRKLTLADYVNDAFEQVFWEITEDGNIALDFDAENAVKLDDLGSSPIKLASMYFKAQAVV